MDALDKLIEALGLPEETEEYGVKFNTKEYYDANPDDLEELLAKNLKDHPEAVFMYLLSRNEELERKVKKIDELESRLDDYFSKLEMGEPCCW